MLNSYNLIREARKNKIKVIEGGLAVEHALVAIIAHHFHPQPSEQRDGFQEMILQSDWCSFAQKKRLVEYIVRKLRLMENKELDEYLRLLKGTMSYRNAFTHGKFTSDGKAVWLSYFESNPVEKELTDDYLQKVEKMLLDAFMATREIGIKSGAEVQAANFMASGTADEKG